MIGPLEKTNTDLIKNPYAPKIKSGEEKDAELRKTCAAFEGMFLEMMMKTMRQSSMESALFKKSNGEKIFTEMLDQQYVDVISSSSDTGLGDSLYNYLKSLSPEHKDGGKGNNFPNKSLNTYELEKLKNAALNESVLDIKK